MRKFIVLAAGGAALASASMANAGIVGSTDLLNVTEVDSASKITIAFEQNQLAAGDFTGFLKLAGIPQRPHQIFAGV